MRTIAWNDCEALVTKYDDDGVPQFVFRCTLEAHADPQDGTAQHRDHSGIWWLIKTGEPDG